MNKFLDIFITAIRLGFIALGGPAAHIGFFRETYVNKKKWLSDQRFAELLAVSQFLPGPASSQLGAAIGYTRAGWLGGFFSWLGFTLPSAVGLIIFGLGVNLLEKNQLSCLHCLMLVALAVVANAIVSMHSKLCDNWKKRIVALIAIVLLIVIPLQWKQPMVIFLGGILGIFLFKGEHKSEKKQVKFSKKLFVYVAASILVVCGIPLLLIGNDDLRSVGDIFKSGSLVFGGGHVVLPLLGNEFVDTGRISEMEFMAGYGLTQAMPGPIFSFSGFIGSKLMLFGSSWLGGAVAILAIFLPGMILMAGFVPVWDSFKRFAWAHGFLKGTNAAVVGLLAHAWFGMIASAEIANWWEWLIIITSFYFLFKKILPIWVIIIGASVLGYVIY